MISPPIEWQNSRRLTFVGTPLTTVLAQKFEVIYSAHGDLFRTETCINFVGTPLTTVLAQKFEDIYSVHGDLHLLAHL